MYKKLSAPHVVQIEISSLCPNNCQYCYNFWRESGRPCYSSNLSLDQADKIIDQMILHHVFHIILTGGEPLANKEVLFRMIEKAKEGGITTAVNSTLLSLRPEDCHKLKQLGVSVVLTSILGPTPEIHDVLVQNKGAFERTVKGIALLQEYGVPVAVNMVVTKKNQNLIHETARLVKSLGLKGFNCTRAGCPGNCHNFDEHSLSLEEFRRYLYNLHSCGVDEEINVDVLSSYPLCGIKEVDKYEGFTSRRCMAGVNTFAVSSAGDVRPCTHIDVNYGNLLSEEFDDIWDKMSEWRDGSMIPSACKTCKVLPRCGGGCRMEAKMRGGSISNLDPYSSPIDANEVYDLLKQRKREEVEIPPKVRINPRMRWRPESFGAAVFAGTRFACYLNHEGIKAMLKLTEYEEITQEAAFKMCNHVGVGFVEGLFERKVLISSN